jgi:tetratricopeptide (TPR) repeat protein
VIELYHHTVRAGQYDEARTLFRDRINKATYYQFGAYQLQIELLRALFPDGEDQPPRLEKESAQAWTLNQLANSYSLSGQPRNAVSVWEVALPLAEQLGQKGNLAIGLGNLATQQMAIGALRAAEANLRRLIALCREIGDKFWEANGHHFLGRLLSVKGDFFTAGDELSTALDSFMNLGAMMPLASVWADRAKLTLMMGDTKAKLESARRVLEVADEQARTEYPVERDYVRAHWLLGAAHRANGNMEEADRHLSEALTRCRSINAVDAEAGILLDLARLRAATASFDSAQGRSFDPPTGLRTGSAQDAREEPLRLAGEALVITERCGYVLQGADVHLFLAQMALEGEEEETAREHARQARRLATCDGPPDHTYKVAYDQAGALLA